MQPHFANSGQQQQFTEWLDKPKRGRISVALNAHVQSIIIIFHWFFDWQITTMTAILTLVVVIVGATVLYNLWLFDCLARWEYEHHREQWERDGKPSGFLAWRPKEPKSLSRVAEWSST